VPGDLPHPVDPRQIDPDAVFGSADSYGNRKLRAVSDPPA
jgi:hypothetical protein